MASSDEVFVNHTSGQVIETREVVLYRDNKTGSEVFEVMADSADDLVEVLKEMVEENRSLKRQVTDLERSRDAAS